MLPAIAVRPAAVGTQEAFRLLFGNQLTEMPKRFPTEATGRAKTLGWVFVSSDCRNMKACRTYQTLLAMSGQHTYYTPNTFYRNDRREEATLRYLNALVIDVDVKGADNPNAGLCMSDLLERISSAGLPCPTMIVRTPSGGYHVYFLLNAPRKAYTNAIQTYRRIQTAIAAAIGGDRQAIGAERWFRLPTPDTLVYASEQRVSFAELLDWESINQDAIQEAKRGSIVQKGLLDHPAVKTLLAGVEVGKRDNTCYTLALAFKREGYSMEDAEAELQEWNTRLDEPMPQRIVSRKVKSAYKGDAPAGPTGEWITYLSGVPFSYEVWETAKPRGERKTSHYSEWAEDVERVLQQLPDRSITDAQRKLASYFGMSLSTYQAVVALMVESGRLTVEVHGKGRGAATTLRLVSSPEPATEQASEVPVITSVKNVPDSNTLTLVGVAGGVLRRSSGDRLCGGLPFLVPSSGPPG
ncbi:hypothetical protein B1748_33585 [Paenibacillus sp. MY03]|uniref:primase C-terminal domain-containing protein n=1 Tax=Paenibacillus sp. MY03 TaxID=302980 RepID=UPI000B3CE732|nr:primase C-terminal domain-containing protein [Paenibacillus sp. MY03]OUS68561.1 hypothetical protein B1748_33585 [Paenibacillus sp. MY03]